MNTVKLLFCLLLFCIYIPFSCKKVNDKSSDLQKEKFYTITKQAIRNHILFLAHDSIRGRATGSPEMKYVTRYIVAQYDSADLKPVSTTYIQSFEFESRRRMFDEKQPLKLKANNIIGLLEGSDPVLKNEYIVLGAHYDHLGILGDTSLVRNGADDNASGVAVMIEVAKKLSLSSNNLKRSILFIAFDGEEHGVKGSSYFVSHPTVPISQIKLMMNLDMMGRINKGDSLAITGGGSFEGGSEILKTFTDTTSIHVYVTNKHMFASDHTPFFRNRIPVICPLPTLHPEYHSHKDDEHLINYDGAKDMCDYTVAVLSLMANQDSIVSTITDPNKKSDGLEIIMKSKSVVFFKADNTIRKKKQ